jgi:hypothetical protein
VIVSGPTGALVGVFVYAAGAIPGPGTGPIDSLTNQTTDPFGNPTLAGVAAYTTLGVVQLGLGSFGGTPAAGLFTHNQGSPANSDPFIGGTSATSSSCSAVLYSGNTTAASVGSGIEAQDSVTSGIASGTVNVVAGQLQFQGAAFYNGTTLTVQNATVTGTLTVGGSTSTGTSGLPDGTIHGTSGGASAGTAHTHGPGSFAVGNGQHSHVL